MPDPIFLLASAVALTVHGLLVAASRIHSNNHERNARENLALAIARATAEKARP